MCLRSILSSIPFKFFKFKLNLGVGSVIRESLVVKVVAGYCEEEGFDFFFELFSESKLLYG